MWDPETVPVGAVVETCSGEYRFKKILEEGPPYFRKYAVLSFRYYHYPDDFGWGFLKKKIDQGKLLIEEQLVIPPDYYVTHQWGAGSGPSFFCGSFTCEEEAAYQRKRRRIYREGKKKKLSWDEIEKLIPRRTHQAFSSIGSVGSLTHKWGGGDGRSSDRNLERKILRAPSLGRMRLGKEVEEFRHTEHPHGCLRCGER